MAQSGQQPRELVFVQEPEVVLAALQEMGSRIVKGPKSLPGADTPEARDAWVGLELSVEALEWLEDLLAGREDPLGRVEVAWRRAR